MMFRFLRWLTISALLLGAPLVVVAFVTDPTLRSIWLAVAVIATISAASAITIGDRVIAA